MAFNRSFATAIILLLLIVSCQSYEEEKTVPGIETVHEVEEIYALTSPGEISESFSSSHDSVSIEDTKLKNFDLVQNFYSSRGFKPIWSNRKLREDLFRNISKAPEEGLTFVDYHGELIEIFLSSLSDLDPQELTQLEILLTDAYFQLAGHLNSGKLNPKELYTIWDIETNETDLSALLEGAIKQNDVAASLDSLRPHHPVYRGLKKSLKEYKKLKDSKEKITTIEEGKSIKPGEEDARIPFVADRLEELGLLAITSADSVSTKYDKKIEEAIKEFQEQHGIEVDGIIGPGTISSLNKSDADRYHQILVNLERWRWYPRDLGEHYILINIANYQLYVVKEGDTVSTHRTMVGTEARRTPVFSDKIEHVVYNPTWIIPPTIKKKDVIPAASDDSSYLAERNISVFNKKGQRLNPEEIDWSSDEVSSYTYRQRAGGSNPLGRVKIIYPNRHLIYLHDTPSQALFKKNTRAQSSGCVRVEGAVELANYLLSDQEKYDKETIEQIISSGKTTTIKVTQDVKVHHLYWTAWRENDTTRFSTDVYNLDQEIYELLATPE